VPDPMPKPLILVVEDDPHSSRIAVAALEHAGFSCQTAANAGEALSALQRQRPNLVLMDFNLPGLDGLQLTRWIKEDDLTRDIPVLAVTAYAMEGDADIARESGCDGYIPKPYDPADLVRETKRLLDATRPGA
jgi:two-component system, cell cycle response regulator DivK